MILGSGQDRHVFAGKLNSVVSPARPIRSIEHLAWRHEELKRIEKALFMTGRNVFIFGDRGVGKSSLAATAAIQWQSSDAEPISVACAPDSTFRSIVACIAYNAISANRLQKSKDTYRAGVKLRSVTLDTSKEITERDLFEEVKTVADAVELLRQAARVHSEKPIVVVDEFDRIKNAEEKEKFADLLKQMGDKSIELRMIFTGVGQSLQDLLGAHASAIRQLDTILLPKLPWDGRYEIVKNALFAFALSIDSDIVMRIAAISDGYPAYVHKIVEKMLWAAFDDPTVVSAIDWRHYQAAVNEAILESYAAFAELYEKAVNQRSDDFEEVLWSTADSEFLQRFVDDMYSSYEYIMDHRSERSKLSQEKFAARIRALKGASCGEILQSVPKKRGMYEYREKMFRGYVRMQAEAHGIKLIGKAKEVPQVTHVPASANRGYYASNPPKGVHMGRKRRP